MGSRNKAKLPRTTRISGTRWRVAPKRQVVLEGEEVEGACHFDVHLLEVSVGSDDEFTILANFWHEVLHAIVFEAGVTLNDEAEHAFIKQAEKYLAANVDFRATPRKPKKPKLAELAGPKLKRKTTR